MALQPAQDGASQMLVEPRPGRECLFTRLQPRLLHRCNRQARRCDHRSKTTDRFRLDRTVVDRQAVQQRTIDRQRKNGQFERKNLFEQWLGHIGEMGGPAIGRRRHENRKPSPSHRLPNLVGRARRQFDRAKAHDRPAAELPFHLRGLAIAQVRGQHHRPTGRDAVGTENNNAFHDHLSRPA